VAAIVTTATTVTMETEATATTAQEATIFVENQSGGGADALRNFKGAIETLPVLGTKVEKATQDYSKFTKFILNYVLTNFTYPQDIAVAITDLKDPIKNLTKDLPTKMKLMREHHLVLQDDTQGTDEENSNAAAYNDDLEETIDLCVNPHSLSSIKGRLLSAQTWQRCGVLLWDSVARLCNK
jgi:hypothetical protein